MNEITNTGNIGKLIEGLFKSSLTFAETTFPQFKS